MQHVVNVAFDFDDDRVKKILEDTTVEKVQKDIKQAIIDEVFEKSDWGRGSHANPENDPLSAWVTRYIKELIGEYKEDIIKQAGKEIAQSMMKSSKWKQMVIEETKAHE